MEQCLSLVYVFCVLMLIAMLVLGAVCRFS